VVLGLNPGTRAITHGIVLPGKPVFSISVLAFAGGQVWATAPELLVAIDPAVGKVVRSAGIRAAYARAQLAALCGCRWTRTADQPDKSVSDLPGIELMAASRFAKSFMAAKKS
jgi:hypothetical protein